MAKPSTKSAPQSTPASPPPAEPTINRLVEALDRCTAVGGTIAARVNDQLQGVAAALPPQQDDLTDYLYKEGTSTTGATSARQSSGNIPAISAKVGADAIAQCLQRALGRGLDFEAIAKAIGESGGAIGLRDVEYGGLNVGNEGIRWGGKKQEPAHPAVRVPR